MIVLAEATELRNVFNAEEMAGTLTSHDLEGRILSLLELLLRG
jgi:hypothetical protein